MAPRFCLCVFPYKRCFFFFIPPIFSLPFENDYKYSNLMFLLYFAFLTILLLLFVCSYRAIIFAIRHLWSSATSTAFRRTCRTHRSANNWKTCESRSDERFAKSSKSKVHFPSYHLNTFSFSLQVANCGHPLWHLVSCLLAALFFLSFLSLGPCRRNGAINLSIQWRLDCNFAPLILRLQVVRSISEKKGKNLPPDSGCC